MDLKEIEIQRAEEYLLGKFSPLVRTFILSSKKIDVKIEQWEQILMDLMNEKGQVDGLLLNKLLQEKYPKVSEWISIPQTEFYLKNELEIIINGIFKGDIII